MEWLRENPNLKAQNEKCRRRLAFCKESLIATEKSSACWRNVSRSRSNQAFNHQPHYDELRVWLTNYRRRLLR